MKPIRGGGPQNNNTGNLDSDRFESNAIDFASFSKNFKAN